ncbi:hypothetical protein ANO11243_059620 [Dothideomycetidae sp. 11243]|nr:hypothetical protein ANO11243_059620 [fungal sp. No.11243]
MAEEEDFSNLPLTERWVHKNWKVRKEAYETAAKEFKAVQETDPLVRDFVSDAGLWKGAAADSNVAAQQEALAALCAFLEIAGTQGCTRTRSYTITPIVEKGLVGRPAAKASALEALMLYIELDKAEPVIEELIPLLSHKQPKIIAATLGAMTALVHAYGCKTVEPKSILKQLPKAYGHADKNVRAEAQNLTVEMYRWLKDAMKPLFWGDLKPVQQTDLEKLFVKVKDEPAPKQERLLRSQQAVQESREAAGANEAPTDGDEVDEPEIDLEPEHMAIDVFPKIPKDLHERLASSKWKDRKEALDELLAAVNVPAIEDGQFDEIIRACAKCMKDANIQVVQIAANSVECIAKGLRKKFAKYRNIILSPMLERFKEKKQSVTDALAGACDGVFLATGITDILEETLEFLKHKNPQVKLESAKFLIRSLKTTREAPPMPEVKSMADAAKSLLGDSQEPTRNAAAEVLGVLWRIMGDRNMLTHLEGLDDMRKNKIKEYCDQAEVKAKWKPKAAAPPPPAKSAAGPAGRKPAVGKRPAAAVKKPAPAPARAPSPEEDVLAPRPTSRPAPRAGAPPRGLQASAGAIKKPALSRPGSMMSPVRAKPQSDDMGAIPPPRGLPTPGRGLTSRPLAKPLSNTSSSANSPPPSPRGPVTGLTSAERSEFTELKSEVELLRQQIADLRTDKLRLQSQIHELQNQNAQLIEDHTRDMLSIKAKETQLVRARSDVDEADQRVHDLQREVERLKRQLSVSSGAMSPPLHSAGSNGFNSNGQGTFGRFDRLGSYDKGDRMEEGKENSLPRELMLPQRLKENAVSSHSDGAASKPRVMSPTMEDEKSGRQSPAGFQRPTARPLSGFAQHQSASGGLGQSSLSTSTSRTSSLGRSNTTPFGASAGQEGQESWRRAAEVTQNLKARIELMKAKQAGRGQAGH